MARRWTRAARRRFLEVLATTGNVSAAARAVGLARSSAYRLRQKDAAFAAAWEDAEQEAVDLLEQEARRRALEGVSEPLLGGGKLIRDDDGRIMTIRRYNDRLLEMLLKAHRPEKFRDRAESHATGAEPRAGALPPVTIVVGADAEPASPPGDGADDPGD